MKQILTGLALTFLMPMILFGQTYDELWKQVVEARVADLPQTEMSVLSRIAKKAEKEHNYGQLLKAELQEATARCTVSPDSLQPAIERLKNREQTTRDEVLRAVYCAVLGSVYQDNRRWLGDDDGSIARRYYDQALARPDLLAQAKALDFAPFVIKGDDSRVYDGDLLSVIAYEAKRYDLLRDYYQQQGRNRQAMLMSSLAVYRQQKDTLTGDDSLRCLDDLIARYGDLTEVGEVAIERYHVLNSLTSDKEEEKWHYQQEAWNYLNQALQRYSRWPRIATLTNILNAKKRKFVRVSMNAYASIPGKSQQVCLTLHGIDRLTMRVYRVKGTALELNRLSPADSGDFKKLKARMTEMREMAQNRAYTGHQPWEGYKDTLTLEGLPLGIYAIAVETALGTTWLDELYHVSDLRLLSQELPGSKKRFVVVNATSGQPVKGAQLRLKGYSNGKDRVATLTTDGHGECEYATKDIRWREVWITAGDDYYCPLLSPYGYFSAYENSRDTRRVHIYIDRAIYRPGQTVHAAAILYTTTEGFRHQADGGKTVTMRLRNANNEVVSEQTLTTDDYGTCAADFTLPQQGLNGQFCIEANDHRQYFRVEEYKRPTFEVEMPDVKETYAAGDTLQVKGTARSYAGVPVRGATVRYTVERKRAFWWMSYSYYWNQGFVGQEVEDETVASGEVTTGDDGSFSVPMPLTMPKTAHPMFYNFVVSAEVTDQAGETRHGELSLPLGNRAKAFSMDLPGQVLREKGGTVTFHLRNAAGTDLSGQVKYRIDRGKWQTDSTRHAIALPRLDSGSHTLEAVCEGDTLSRQFVAFSLDEQRTPIETDDWFYVSDRQFPNDGSPVTLQVGSSAKDVHIVYTIIAGDTVIESGSVDKSNALVNRRFTYRDDYGNGLLLTFAWVKAGIVYTHQTTIRRPLPDKTLKMQWQTFRDRLTPGQQEQWTLTILSPDGKPVQAQMMATLYDKSLDQLVAHQWSLTPYVWLPIANTAWCYNTWHTMQGERFEDYTAIPVPNLAFNRFDHTLYPSGNAVIAYGRMFVGAVMKSRAAANDEMMADAMPEMAVGAQTASSTADMIGAAADAEEADNGGQSAETSQVQTRENLQETAFFYPQLTADSTGCVRLKFTLPESLTTWRFMSLAHTEDMMVGTLTDEAVAKKDVMIQPNMPRFVRIGDRATISARIFNTGDKAVSGKARLELIDPATGQTVYADEQSVEVPANGQIAAAFLWVCTEQTPSLLVAKITASGEGFSDGEQHYLPVLTNKERVTITMPFTQTEPGTKEIQLIAAPLSSSTLTIEYTNNPAWLMIQALPEVGHPHDNCAICQATSYYANSIGRHILAQNAHAKHIFRTWQHETINGVSNCAQRFSRWAMGTTSLHSQLEKNQELKDLVLNETPWVMEANSERDQRQRLADFFDENLMDQRLATSLGKLKSLQQSDGSWSWWPGMRGSMYMTVEVSEMLVRLKQMTAVHHDTEKMLNRAFDFMGREIIDMVNEMKKHEKASQREGGVGTSFPSHMALQWLYICTLDGRQLPAKVRAANDYLIRLLKKETRNQSIYDKAMTAIVLNNKTYVKSLKEYTVYKEDMGRYYDTPRALYSWRDYRIPTQVAAIEAIKRLTPEDTKTISEMQRWLLQQKRTQSWDTPINSADAVYAFLHGDSVALAAQPKTVLKVDGKELPTSEATAGLGYVKTTLPGNGKRSFTAEKTSTGTSWGAVYMQFMQPAADIKAQQSGISVSREIMMAPDTSSLSNLHSALKVGDRITVRITIEADRDYDFVQVADKRAACMEPVRQLSGYHWGYYTVPKDCATHYFFDRLAKGRHVIETEYYIDRAGTYETGTCTAECAYSPEFRGTAPSITIQVK